MTVPPCFFLQADVFPAVRAEASRRLIRAGWRQQRIADALQTSQTMVSRYTREPDAEDPLIVRLAEDVERQVSGTATTHASWCDSLAKPTQSDPDRTVLASLLLAEHLVRQDPPSALMPQVGLNIAMALPGAATPEDVMAFPGRFLPGQGGLAGGGPPTPGASRHLATVLLHVRARFSETRAIMNVKGSAALGRVAQAHGSVWLLEGGEGDRAEQVHAEADRRRKAPDFIQDPGGFGLEPCLYILGRDAVQCVDRMRALMHEE